MRGKLHLIVIEARHPGESGEPEENLKVKEARKEKQADRQNGKSRKRDMEREMQNSDRYRVRQSERR